MFGNLKLLRNMLGLKNCTSLHFQSTELWAAILNLFFMAGDHGFAWPWLSDSLHLIVNPARERLHLFHSLVYL